MISCNVEADPPVTEFYWSFNNSVEVINIPKYQYKNKHYSSELMFTPASGYDYGMLLCTSRNKVGRQEKPCQISIYPAGEVKRPS